MKKYFFYYGTEENAYEIDKLTYDNVDQAIAEVEDVLEGSDEQINKDEFKKEVEEDGYAFVETINPHGYHILVGIATQGHCQKFSRVLRAYRRDFIACF